MKADLLLLHAPSSWSFRERTPSWGPISGVIPSTPVFEMYPMGFVSIAEYLHRHGYKVDIANIALRMLDHPKTNVERLISSMKAKLFGIDLHWMVHANGSIELARLCKKIHPQTKIVFGGLSSTFFADELIQEDAVDFVIKGDSAELPILRLLQELEKTKPNYSNVPNLVYRDQTIVDNGISYVPETLDDFTLDYKYIVKMLTSVRGLKLRFPYRDYMKHPLLALFTIKGCTNNCILCGGSKYFYKTYCKRTKPAFRSAEQIIRDLLAIESYVKLPVFFVSDIQQAGADYWKEIFSKIKSERIDLPFAFELFSPAPKEFFEQLSGLTASVQISPDSWSEKTRELNRKPSYSNAALEKNITYALDVGVEKFDIYYMIGLIGQTQQEFKDTLSYMDQNLATFGEKLHYFIAPMAPFLDPGSIAYDNPEKYGITKFCSSVKDHYQALTNRSWKNLLSYESTLSREEIVQYTYDTVDRLFDIKVIHGHLSQKEYTIQKELLRRSKESYQRLERDESQNNVSINDVAPNLDAPTLTTNKELYFGDYSILSLRSVLRLIRRKLFR